MENKQTTVSMVADLGEWKEIYVLMSAEKLKIFSQRPEEDEDRET